MRFAWRRGQAGGCLIVRGSAAQPVGVAAVLGEAPGHEARTSTQAPACSSAATEGHRHLRFLFLLTLISLTGLLCASPSLAASPWWHLTSSSRPGYLPVGGSAVNEVEELTVRATQGYFYMEDSENGKNDLLPRLFGTPPYPLAFDATAAEVQTVLEDFYGSANVTVSEVSGQPADTHAWKIKFAGGLSGRPIQPLKAESDFYVELFEPPATGLKVETGPGEFEAGSASAQQITEGSFHGSQIVVQAANLGDAAANGGCVEVAAGIGKYSNSECTEEAAPGTGEFEKHTISISDTLPEGLEAARVEAAAGISLTDEEGLEPRPECAIMTPRTVECTFKGTLPAYALIEVDVGVIVTEAARTGEQNEASVSGGEGRSASVARPITASDAPTPFGVQDYELTPEEEGGTADTQAGSHPFQVTGTLTLNQTAEAEPAQLPKEVAPRPDRQSDRLPEVHPAAVLRSDMRSAVGARHRDGDLQGTLDLPPAGQRRHLHAADRQSRTVGRRSRAVRLPAPRHSAHFPVCHGAHGR